MLPAAQKVSRVAQALALDDRTSSEEPQEAKASSAVARLGQVTHDLARGEEKRRLQQGSQASNSIYQRELQQGDRDAAKAFG